MIMLAHHEATLSLFQQLLLTGTLVICPAVQVAVHRVKTRRANRRKLNSRGEK